MLTRPRHSAKTAFKAAQDWLPLRDLHDGLLYRPDGAVVGGVAVAPFNLSLKSTTEQQAVIAAVHAALNALDVAWEILSVYRPVDLDAYLASLDAMLQTADQRRKPVLRDYLQWVHALVRSGEHSERRYYVLVVRQGVDATAEHRQHLPQLAGDMARARGMQVRVMTDADWRELLFLAFHGPQAAVEQVPDGLPRLAPGFQPADKGGAA